jgi:arylsulfatase A-like enzyme
MFGRPSHRAPGAARGAGLAAALLVAAGCARPAPRPINLVVVCVDTLRADHLGAYGYPRDTSPRLDALATGGVLFTDAAAQSNWTIPATATLLTSLYPSEHGARVDGAVKNLAETKPTQIRPEVRTLGQILKNAGFRTALLSANPYLFGRFQRGFERAVARRLSATELTDQALAWVEAHRAEPFFLYLQYMDLHHPIAPPEPYFGRFPVPGAGPRRREVHASWKFAREADPTDPEFQAFRAHKIALYDGALAYIDAEVGRLLDRLAAPDLAGRSLVVATSDHGEEFWDHLEAQRRLGGDPRGVAGVGHGHTMYQELLRVPLVFHGPGVAAGRRLDCPVRHLDVAPTVLDLLGVARPDALAAMRGRSLRPQLDGEEAEPCGPAAQVAEAPAYGPDAWAATWSGRKLIRRGDGVEQLFDLRSDPLERRDLAAAHPEVVEDLRRVLAAELVAPAGGDGGERMEYDEERERQLRALGYL